MNEDGERLMTSVERLLDSPETIRAYVKGVRAGLSRPSLETLGEELVSQYATTTGMVGAAVALPAAFPGIGTLATMLGGALVDVSVMLKYDVEMTLALLHVYDFDIEGDEERQLALALTGLSWVAEKSDDDMTDYVRAEMDAIWAYGGHHLTKVVATVFAKVALLQLGKGAARAVPLAGVVLGAGMNHTLTTRVGHQVLRTVKRRREEIDAGRAAAAKHGVQPDADGIVDAFVEGDEE